MTKILISWIARENDFIKETGKVNPLGPTMQVHNHYYNEYDYHLLLSQSTSVSNDLKCEYLLNLIHRTFPERIIKPVAMSINDVIDLNEISGKISALLLSNKKNHIDIFISPGTPTMQVAWYLAHQSLGINTKLFQLRRPEHSKNKIPEQVWVNIEKSKHTSSIIIQQETLEHQEDTNAFITPTLQTIYSKAKKISSADRVSVLISGETGTGKERLARYIHDHSPRAKGNFVAINCSSMHDELLESRLFGYVKGSHNQALKDTIGLFHQAIGGTIFLDEIGDITSYMQQCLLRVMQEKEVLRIGGLKAESVDVRIISATNKNLYEMCSRNEFREDLYYRLAVTELHLPPLIEYPKTEKELFFDFLWKQAIQKFNIQPPVLPKEIKKQILTYSFPGNIREMENLIDRLFAESENDVTIENLPKRIIQPSSKHSWLLEDVEKEHIKKALTFCKGNITQASKLLGISYNNLKNKIK